jgi:tRNA-dihydrouridine synthase
MSSKYNFLKKISSKLNIPVIAHGGAGNFEHIKKLIQNTNIDGVAISSLLHYSAAPYFIKNFKNTGNTHFLETLKKLITETHKLPLIVLYVLLIKVLITMEKETLK